MNEDLSSQLGLLVLLCAASDRFHVIYYCSMKSKRVFRSVMGAATCAFMDGFDIAYSVAKELELVLNKSLCLY